MSFCLSDSYSYSHRSQSEAVVTSVDFLYIIRTFSDSLTKNKTLSKSVSECC